MTLFLFRRPAPDYSTHLRSSRWSRFRRRVRASRKRCVGCGSARALHVHHRHYRALGRERFWHVLLVCHRHHMRGYRGSIHTLQDRLRCSTEHATRVWLRRVWAVPKTLALLVGRCLELLAPTHPLTSALGPPSLRVPILDPILTELLHELMSHI